MSKSNILHILTTAKNMSPFDVNMAIDGGFDHIVPYTNVLQDEVIALTQDAMFSRTPSSVKHEAMFFGGRDIHVAIEMQAAAKSAMFAPFQFSTFSDPSGAFTTAAALVAKINQLLEANQWKLANETIAIFGASGAVGTTSALIAAEHGAKVQLVAHQDVKTMQTYADSLEARYGVKVSVVDGSNDTAKTALLKQASVAICATPAGRRIIETAHLTPSQSLKIVVDVNAVPPSGVAGLDALGDGVLLPGTQILGIGALAIGQLKYGTQHELLKRLIAEAPIHLAYQDAYLTALKKL